MGRPSTTQSLCQELKDFLLSNGVPPGQLIPRSLFDKLVVQAAGLSVDRSAQLVRNGAAAGLWLHQVSRGPGRGGGIILLATNPQPTKTPTSLQET